MEIKAFLEELLLHRNEVCHQHVIEADHQHCIGCTLVMDHMRRNFPDMKYGTEEQWIEESAFCLAHERDILAEFISKGGSNGQIQQA